MGKDQLSALSIRSLFIASFAWFVVLAWSNLLNTTIDSAAAAFEVQDGWQEIVMRLAVALTLTVIAYGIYKHLKRK